MKVYIRNNELPAVIFAIGNARKYSEDIRAIIRLKLQRIIDDVYPAHHRYQGIYPSLLDDYVKKGKDGEHLTIQEGNNVKFDFKSDEDKDKFLEVSEDFNEIRLSKPLSESDLEEIRTGTDKYGSAEMHFQNLLLVTEGEARTELPEDETETKDDKEDES